MSLARPFSSDVYFVLYDAMNSSNTGASLFWDNFGIQSLATWPPRFAFKESKCEMREEPTWRFTLKEWMGVEFFFIICMGLSTRRLCIVGWQWELGSLNC